VTDGRDDRPVHALRLLPGISARLVEVFADEISPRKDDLDAVIRFASLDHRFEFTHSVAEVDVLSYSGLADEIR
jgi:hypothetical protein